MLRAIQRTGQLLFLQVEKGFNLLFGDKLNPLYHLGAIAYLMVWIVTASGLYLYIFFDTGVTAAYVSIERIGHEQWVLGQVMRGLHRYGSDAMVFAMGLHMARHFLFDRYRGFRWFSWISGVAVLWLVYASGVNGFMLPWDRLAQFVTTATAEWFDWLPFFTEPIARNFLHQGSVNDRLFTLLVFMHIGIPLFLLLVLWIHTQRVPKAESVPPRPITMLLLIALVAFSLVKPVLSQGPADLDRVAMQLQLDWFYLAVYPLIYEWSPRAVWWTVGAGTMLLALLPWLPPRRRGQVGEFQLLVRPGDQVVAVRDNETILEAGLRAGLALPFDCRSGGCGVCKCSVLQGSVDYGVYQAAALSDEERGAGKVLMCCATALSDLEIECEQVPVRSDIPVRVFQARVEKLERLAADVMCVYLKAVDGEPIRFHAGQYINILFEGHERRAFSFATPPGDNELIELHIRLIPGGKFTTHVFNAMRAGDVLACEGPLGSFTLREDSTRPIIFVAGSTGFAPVKSMLEYAFQIGLRRPMYFYWGVRSRQDMYMRELAEHWEREHENFKFIPVLEQPMPEDRWNGRTGRVHEAIVQDFPDLAAYEVYACGSVGMVEAAHSALLQQGLLRDRCFSDTFSFAPQLRSGRSGEVVRAPG